MSKNENTYPVYLKLAIDFSFMFVIQILMKETYYPSNESQKILYRSYLFGLFFRVCCLFARLLKMLIPRWMQGILKVMMIRMRRSSLFRVPARP